MVGLPTRNAGELRRVDREPRRISLKSVQESLDGPKKIYSIEANGKACIEETHKTTTIIKTIKENRIEWLKM